jgi:hypothetical protein
MSRYLTQMGHVTIHSLMHYVPYSSDTWAQYVSYIRGVRDPSSVQLQTVTVLSDIPWFFHEETTSSADFMYESDSDSE